jgi:hypothetical protein
MSAYSAFLMHLLQYQATNVQVKTHAALAVKRRRQTWPRGNNINAANANRIAKEHISRPSGAVSEADLIAEYANNQLTS